MASSRVSFPNGCRWKTCSSIRCGTKADSDPDEAARKWAQSHGGVPINHMVVLRETIAKSRPDVAKELFRLLLAGKRALKSPTDGTALDPLRFGVEACRPTLEIIIDYCVRQKLLPRKIAVDA